MLFETRDLTRVFRQGDARVTALSGVTLAIDEGAFVAVAGPSGCGKTTLLQVLGLLDAGFDGTVRLKGRSLAELSARRRARLRLTSIGFVFQHACLHGALDVRDNVALPHWRLHGSRRRAYRRAEQLLGDLGLSERLRTLAPRLSGGEAQRAALARALVNDPPVLLADEPTGNLDSATSAAVLALLRAQHEAGRTLVVVSHDPEVVAGAPRVVRLRDGRVVEGPGSTRGET